MHLYTLRFVTPLWLLEALQNIASHSPRRTHIRTPMAGSTMQGRSQSSHRAQGHLDTQPDGDRGSNRQPPGFQTLSSQLVRRRRRIHTILTQFNSMFFVQPLITIHTLEASISTSNIGLVDGSSRQSFKLNLIHRKCKQKACLFGSLWQSESELFQGLTRQTPCLQVLPKATQRFQTQASEGQGSSWRRPRHYNHQSDQKPAVKTTAFPGRLCSYIEGPE